MFDRIEPGVQNFKNDPEIVVDGDIRPNPINMTSGGVQRVRPSPSTSKLQAIKQTAAGIAISIDIKSSVASGADNAPSKTAKISVPKNVTFAEQVKKEHESVILVALAEKTQGPVQRVEKVKSALPKTPKFKPVEIPCQYASCGCQETVPQGTILEQDHYENCNFRPIPCLLEDVCGEVIPYHDFILHMITHFVKPEYTLTLGTRIYLWAEDFLHDQKWNPKWLCAQGNHFFVMMQRKIPGIWISWVWMLGSKEEACAYKYTLFYFKGLRSVGGTFTVHSIRETPEQIEMNKSCLLLTDQAMMSLSQMGDNVLTDFSVSVQISLNTMEDYEAALAEPKPTEATSPAPTPNAISPKLPEYSAALSGSTLPQKMPSSVQQNSFENSTAPSVPTFGTLSTVGQSDEGSSLAAATSLEFSPSEDSDFVQFIPSDNFPMVSPDYGYQKAMSGREELEEDGMALEEFLKIFTANRVLPAYESSVSTEVTEKRSELDREFLFEDILD